MKKIYTEESVADIADAIREKNGTNNTYKTSEMAAAIENLQGERTIVNGIVEQYKAATTTISADTLVEFVNGSLTDAVVPGADTNLATVPSESYYAMCAVALDASKVFIVLHGENYLYGVVCTISGTTITAGTIAQVTPVNALSNYVSAVALDSSRVFITCARIESRLCGVVCTINGTTITAGTDTQLSTVTNSYYYASAVALGINRVFVAHRNGRYLYGVVCTINGTTITAGTDTQLSTGVDSYFWNSATLIDTDTVFIAHYGDSYLYGVVCTINGTTITAGTDTQLSSTSTVAMLVSAVALNTNQVFVAHRIGGNGDTNDIHGVVAEGSRTIKASETKIEGLTKTEATTSTVGDVWVLNTNESD